MGSTGWLKISLCFNHSHEVRCHRPVTIRARTSPEEKPVSAIKLGGMNIAGNNVMHPPPAFPSVVAEFGVASAAKGTPVS